jgi:hypothetical protein
MDSSAATPLSGPGTGLLPLLGGVLRAEARKLHTVRSSWWALLAGLTVTVATAAVLGAVLPGHLSIHQKAAIDSVRVSLGGLHLAQIGFGLGAALRSGAGAVAALFGLLFIPPCSPPCCPRPGRTGSPATCP